MKENPTHADDSAESRTEGSLHGVVKARVSDKKGNAVMTCPKCGYDEFVVSVRMSGRGEYAMRLDGGSGDNTSLHDCLTYNLGKIALCANCNKVLGKYSEP